MAEPLQFPGPAAVPVRAKRFADLGWAGGRDERGSVLVAVDLGTETTCVSTFPRGYENSTSVLTPTTILADDPHAFRTLERRSFAVGSTALSHWPSDRALRGPQGSLRLSSQIGLVEFPAEHVLAGLIAKAGEQHGRSAEQVLICLPPFLPADRVETIRRTVGAKSRLKLAGRAVPTFLAGAYFYLLPALTAGERKAKNDLETWSTGALADGRLLLLDWGASALTYGIVDFSVREKSNELRLVTAGAWPSLGGHALTAEIFRELKVKITDAIIRVGPADLRGRYDNERIKGDVWKPDFYDAAYVDLKRLVDQKRAEGPEADRLRNMILPTRWVFDAGEEPRGYAPIRKVAIAHAKRLWEQAELFKKAALSDPHKYTKDPFQFSLHSLKSRFVEHVQPDFLMLSAKPFLNRVHRELARFFRYVDGVAGTWGRKAPHIAIMGMQGSSRLLSDTLVQVTSSPQAKNLAKASVAPIAETALEVKSIASRGAALLRRDEAEVTIAGAPEILPFSIAIADAVGNIEIFRPGPIDELSVYQRRLHVDAGFPQYEFFMWDSEDGTRSGAWGAIDFNKPEQWTDADRQVRVDQRFNFGKSGQALPRIRDWKKNTAELSKCFDRLVPGKLDGRISLRAWAPKDEPDALTLLVFFESDLVTTFRKRVFLLEREFDPPPARYEFIYQRYYLSKVQELIVVREWWAPAPGDGKLRRNKTLHICTGSTQSRGILGTEWGRD